MASGEYTPIRSQYPYVFCVVQKRERLSREGAENASAEKEMTRLTYVWYVFYRLFYCLYEM